MQSKKPPVTDNLPARPIETLKPASLTFEDQRQILYSSLLRYSPETSKLREQAIDRVVLGALIESTKDQPFRIGKIQENLNFSEAAPKVRIELIQESVFRLIEQKKVEETDLNKRHAYFLADKGLKDISNITFSIENLFQTVLRKLLKDTEHHFSYEEGAEVCRKFIFECFSRFGSVIARSVAGNLSNDNLLNLTDTESAFTSAIKGKNLSTEAVLSLKARCQSFLKSSNPDSEKLKFHVTQGYYFTQLLDLKIVQLTLLQIKLLLTQYFISTPTFCLSEYFILTIKSHYSMS